MAPTLGNINPAMIGPGDIVVNATLGQSIETNVTTIDGGKITTNTLNADRIIAGTSMTSPLINGGTINGGTINGVNIIGSVIKASWIDYSSTGVLTNWQYYTLATIPAAYEANFAHDSSTGLLIVDDLGYVRLPTVVPVTSSYASGSTGGGESTFYAYNDYQVPITNRPITPLLRMVGNTSFNYSNHITTGIGQSLWTYVNIYIESYYYEIAMTQSLEYGLVTLKENGVTVKTVTYSGYGGTATGTYNKIISGFGTFSFSFDIGEAAGANNTRWLYFDLSQSQVNVDRAIFNALYRPFFKIGTTTRSAYSTGFGRTTSLSWRIPQYIEVAVLPV